MPVCVQANFVNSIHLPSFTSQRHISPFADALTVYCLSPEAQAFDKQVMAAVWPNNSARGLTSSSSERSQRHICPSWHPVTIVPPSSVSSIDEIQCVGALRPQRTMGRTRLFPAIVFFKAVKASPQAIIMSVGDAVGAPTEEVKKAAYVRRTSRAILGGRPRETPSRCSRPHPAWLQGATAAAAAAAAGGVAAAAAAAAVPDCKRRLRPTSRHS